MRRPAVVTLAFLLFAPAGVAAAAPSDACTADFTAMVTEMQADCAQVAANDKKRKDLNKTDEDATNNAAEIGRLDDETSQIKRERPLLAAGLCKARTHTCDTLASLLSIDGDPKSIETLATATKQASATADEDVAKNAATSDRQTANNKSGSSAQVEPVESLQPITLAGGAIALAGTRSGTKGVGVVTINPLALADPRSIAASRVLDLSVSAPFSFDKSANEDAQYVSVRLRADLTAPFRAAPLEAAVTEWLTKAGRFADDLEEVLAHAKSVRKCAEYIAIHKKVSQDACEQDLDTAQVRDSREAAYSAIDIARRAADRYYFGADVRFDTGDPTGTEVVGDKGTNLVVGLGAGLRISQGKRWDWELRMRAAGDYFASRDDDAGRPEPVYSFDWGGAFIFSGRTDDKAKQRLALGIGVEGRHAGANMSDARRTPTNFANLNVMALIPAVNGADLGLAMSIPLAEKGVERGTVVSLSTDLGLLDHSSN